MSEPEDAPITGTLSPLEERFEALRKQAGFWLAPLVFFGLWFAEFPALSVPAHKLAAILGTVVVLWVTEALPMPMTAFLAAAAAVGLGVAPAKQVFAPFAEPLMFLFIGSFMLAQAIFLHGLDRRLAFGVMSLRWVGTSPAKILFAYGGVTAFISAWISNTATTAMMYAIGLSIIGFLREREGEQAGEGREVDRVKLGRYATVLLLMTSFAASIGGLATPIGTPPNAIGLGFLRSELHVDIPFFDWMRIGVPVVLVLYGILFGILWWFGARGLPPLAGSDELLRTEAAKLGRWTTGQISTLIAFLVTVGLWILPGIVALGWGEASPFYIWLRDHLPEAVPALIGAGLLFLLPGNRGERAITWGEASRIEWGVVFLYGGGFALGELARQTGLAQVIGESLTSLLPGTSGFGLVVAATLVAVLVSEATSNTAAANIVIPVVIPLARSAGFDPLAPALAATMAASLGFMLPVSTPCNAIVYGSGLIPLTRMIRYGVLLDIAGIVTIVTLVSWLADWVR